MTYTLAQLINDHAFWIGFMVGAVVIGFSVLAICRARFYDAGYDRGWRDHTAHNAAHKPFIHNW